MLPARRNRLLVAAFAVAAASAAAEPARSPEALRQAMGLSRTLGTAPQMATDLCWEPPVLRFRFPANVRQTVQDLERERANPHLLAALATVLPGLKEVDIQYDGPPGASETERPEDRLRREPAFQELLRMSGGEVVEIRREG